MKDSYKSMFRPIDSKVRPKNTQGVSSPELNVFLNVFVKDAFPDLFEVHCTTKETQQNFLDDMKYLLYVDHY